MKFDMKKRILALALAGTTAFSVFGAATSAYASTHVAYANDAYTTYAPAEVTLDSSKVTDGEETSVYTVVGTTTWAQEHSTKTVTASEKKQLKTLANALKLNANITSAVEALGYKEVTPKKLYVVSTEDGVSVTTDSAQGTEVTVTGTYYTKANTGVCYTGDISSDIEAIANALESSDKNDVSNKVKAQLTNISTEIEEWITDNVEYQELYSTTTSTVTTPSTISNGALTNYGNGTISDAELSRDGDIVDPATVYAYDYFRNDKDVVAFVEAFEGAKWVRSDKTSTIFENSDNYGAELYNEILKSNVGENETNLTNMSIKDGFSTYNYNRSDVLEEYIDFLAELGLVDYTTTNKVVATGLTKANFLSAYDYTYYDAATDSYNDLYRFETLVNDIYATVDGIKAAYNTGVAVNYSSSNLVYLMQQYDKYTGNGYVTDATSDLSDSRWAELLISVIESVDAGDFTASAGTAYKAYKTNGEKAIAAYENATTAAAQESAILGLYNAATAAYGRSAGVDKTELVDTLNSLYFNNKTVPDTYLAAVSTDLKIADLVLYGYNAAEFDDASIGINKTKVQAVYPLYPQDDYLEAGNTVSTYIGNSGTYGSSGTDEYEWFVNVYELATTVNGMAKTGSYQNVVDTVNAALEDAVADLTVTYTARPSTALRVEEAVAKYADKIESDYIAKYWNAFAKATDFADEAVGFTQAKYALEMVVISGETLGYQSAQTTITKSDIADLKSAITNASTALKALKADSSKYSAAQALALTNAIAAGNDLVAIYNGTVDGTTVNATSSSKKVGDKDQIVVSDITNAISAIDSAINYSSVELGWSKNSDGAWQYGEADGYVQSGWKQINSVWYYFENGVALQSTWKQIDGKWYYLNSNCGAAYGWAKVDGSWYYFGGDNAMKTGWVKVDGSWYYLNAGGKMVTGWAEVNGTWYYFSKESNALGQMLANTTTPDGYTVDANGALVD
jgi:glucan-binding YG repeat protein